MKNKASVRVQSFAESTVELFDWHTSLQMIGPYIACWVKIVPAVAELILEQWHIPNNRNRGKTYVNTLAHEMKTKAWCETGDSIKFDTNRKCCDGQNRLAASVKSGCSFSTMVLFGIPPKAMPFIDQGKKRSVRDCVRIAGGELSHEEGGIIRYMHSAGASVSSIPHSRKLRIVYDLIPFLEWHGETFRTRKRTNVVDAPFRSAVCRAWHTPGVDHKRLAEFVEVVFTGIPSESAPADDSSALVFARQCTDRAKDEDREVRYKRTTVAIAKFLSRTKVRMFVLPTEELYPLRPPFTNR